MVSHQRVKTPTAAAAFLTDHAQAVYDNLYDAQNRIARHAQQKLTALLAQFSMLEGRLPMILDKRLLTESHRLELIAEKLKALDPKLLLRRGYSITMKDGHALRNPQELRQGDEIVTILEEGTVKSIIQ